MSLGNIIVNKKYELTGGQAQALVDFEAMLADLGLKFYLYCKSCHLISDPAECEGSAEGHDDGTLSFKVTCRCQERTYRGTIILPPPPRELRDRRIDLTVKPEELLNRRQMKCWQAAADVMHQLKLVYIMRCMACQMENRDTDGVWGKGESTSSEFVVECACTKRVYRGSDAPLGH